MTIVAECGQNHLGDMERARQLIMLAKENGADLAKFQLYDHKSLYKDYPDIPNVELSKEQAFMLFNYGKEIGMEVFFSVFDAERVKWCEEMGVKRYKLGYSQWANWSLWKDLPNLIISAPYKIQNVTTLYCVPHYPAQLNELEFNKISFNDFDGFSDHTIGLEAAKIALARGAEIIEKHFSLCYNIGIDGKWSMTPEDLRELKRWETVCRQCL